MRGSPHGSPTRPPLLPSHAGTNALRNEINPQCTGTTTLARQFTGLGYDGGLLRQLTGGGLSPTRQLGRESPTKQFGKESPTKQLGATRGWAKVRPKSVIGVRGKSLDEGRGMFLVKQMTGGQFNHL
jgi:hypothetical protein